MNSTQSKPTRVLRPQELPPRDLYRLLTSIVVPRPIAWISSIDNNGQVNLAPFSFFNAVAGTPPTVMVSIAAARGRPKDTLRNILETREFVIHLVEEDMAAKMNLTSGEWPYDVSEFEVAKLTSVPSNEVRPPRLADAAVALETRLSQVIPVEDSIYTMVLGRVVCFQVRADLLRPSGLVDVKRLQPIARLGGDEYIKIGDVFEMPRPIV